MKPKNIKEFKALVERYESITIVEIEENWESGIKYEKVAHRVSQKLTGFGGMHTCTLCIAVNKACKLCVYGGMKGDIDYFPCNSQINEESYDSIDTAKTPDELLTAFRARAEHLRKTYPQYL